MALTDALLRPWRIPGAVYQQHNVQPSQMQVAPVVAADMLIAKPALSDAPELLAFELENRTYFESWISPRAPEYYSIDGVTEAILLSERETVDDLGHQYLVKVAGAIVGRINLNHVLRPYFNKVELGYRMGQRHAGKGYATQAVSLLLAEAFHRLNFTRVEATVREVNRGSLRVLEKNGFRRYGKSQRSVQFNGEWFDLLHLCTERGAVNRAPIPGERKQ